jgi:hypothetical protein
MKAIFVVNYMVLQHIEVEFLPISLLMVQIN